MKCDYLINWMRPLTIVIPVVECVKAPFGRYTIVDCGMSVDVVVIWSMLLRLIRIDAPELELVGSLLRLKYALLGLNAEPAYFINLSPLSTKMNPVEGIDAREPSASVVG